METKTPLFEQREGKLSVNGTPIAHPKHEKRPSAIDSSDEEAKLAQSHNPILVRN